MTKFVKLSQLTQLRKLSLSVRFFELMQIRKNKKKKLTKRGRTEKKIKQNIGQAKYQRSEKRFVMRTEEKKDRNKSKLNKFYDQSCLTFQD